jgi:parallel beta-helix repeat protein
MISDNIISGNSAYAFYSGGGIFCYDSSPTIQNNTIEDNSGSYSGGGIGCDGGYAVIAGNTIRSNSAYYGGGGVYCYRCRASILGNWITDNSGAHGGGIDCDLAWAEISDNAISGNSAG